MAKRTKRLNRHECPSPSAYEVSCRVRAGKLPGRSLRQKPASPRGGRSRHAVEIGSPAPAVVIWEQQPPAGLGVTALSSPERVTKDTVRDRSARHQTDTGKCGAP